MKGMSLSANQRHDPRSLRVTLGQARWQGFAAIVHRDTVQTGYRSEQSDCGTHSAYWKTEFFTRGSVLLRREYLKALDEPF